jgi:hypothetical protein
VITVDVLRQESNATVAALQAAHFTILSVVRLHGNRDRRITAQCAG